MENLMSIPLLPDMDTEEGKIMSEMVHLVTYICAAPTLCRQELATKLLGVSAKFMDTLNSQKLKIQSLEKQLADVNEQPEDANESFQHHEENWDDSDPWDCYNTNEENEEATDVKESIQLDEDNWEDAEPLDCYKPKECQVDQLLIDLKGSKTGQMIVSPTSEYQVEAILGSGSFGVVAQCVKQPGNETVALKVLKWNTSIKKAEEEVKMLDSLQALGSERFNILSCKDSFIYDGHFCIEFRKLDIPLLDHIEALGSLELKDIRPVLHQVTVALCLLKEAGLIHTDLKPENIMLVDRVLQPLKLQVIDFGEAMPDPEKWVGVPFQTLWYRAPEVVLGVLCDYTIDVWSLGCIAAELLTGTPLFDVCSEAELIQEIVSLVGQPSNDVLERGLNTEHYFEKSSDQPTQDWILMPLDESPQTSSTDKHRKLRDLVKVPDAVPTEDEQAVECDWLAFLDLLEKMLRTDASERITAQEILSHPFMTLSHLSHESHNSYVKSSVECMKICNNWSCDGGENAQQPISNTSSSEANVTMDQPPNNEEEPSVQEVFIRGEKGSPKEICLVEVFIRGEKSSPKEMCLEDSNWSECAISSPEQNEEETPCKSSDCSAPSTENNQSKSHSKRRGFIGQMKRLKAVIKKKIKKWRS